MILVPQVALICSSLLIFVITNYQALAYSHKRHYKLVSKWELILFHRMLEFRIFSCFFFMFMPIMTMIVQLLLALDECEA